MGGRTAVAPAALLWAGLLAGAHLDAGVAAVWLALSGIAGLLAAIALPRTGAALMLVCAFAAGASRGGARQCRDDATCDHAPADGAIARFEAIVDEPPRLESGDAVAQARVIAGATLPLGARVRLRLPAGAVCEWGDTLLVLARLERFEPSRNPGGFDARAAAQAAGVVLHGRVFTARVFPARGAARLPVAVAMRLRRGMEGALARVLTSRARELAAPLLFGDRSAMSPEMDARLRGSGLVHLLALSGLHVAWLAAVARGLCALVRGGLVARAMSGATCAMVYALLAGPLPSLMRAVAGESLTALARLTQRSIDPVQSLAVSALVLLAWRPGWAHDLGFQLSYAATLGLVTLGGPLASPLARWPRAHALVLPLATTLAAQITALPLLLARFHALPWTGIAANLIAVPLSELLLAAAWMGGMLEAIGPGAGRVWLAACEPLAAGIAGVAAIAASLPLALLPCGANPALPLLAASGAALLALSLPAPRTIDVRAPASRARRQVVAGALGAVLFGCALMGALFEAPLSPPRGTFWLIAIDVGQGDALALGCGGEWWLVDAGPRTPHWDAGEGAVLPFLRWAGVRRLGYLILTHDDGDHTGGAAAVRRSMRVRETLASAPRPGVPGPAARFQARTIGRGDTLATKPRARVLWPPRPGGAGEALARRGDNAAALVIEVGEGAGRVLLMADADSLVEAQLNVLPGVAVLKAGHHGSGSSSGAAFVARALPVRALLSVGRRNAYGHPHPLALERLASRGARLDRTDQDGAVWYELSPMYARRVEWRGGDWRGGGALRWSRPPKARP